MCAAVRDSQVRQLKQGKQRPGTGSPGDLQALLAQQSCIFARERLGGFRLYSHL